MTDFYKKKKKFFKRFNNYLCPLCMSDLKVVNNKYECTGEKLELWRQKTDEFLSMNEEQKKEYLKNIQDVDIFMEWTKKDRIECEFTSVLESYSDRYSMIPDPMVVNRIEKSLKRTLTEFELEPDYIFYRKGKEYSLEEKSGYYEYCIPRCYFEDL